MNASNNVNSNQTKKELLNVIMRLKKTQIFNMIQDFNKKNMRNQRSQNNQSLKQSVNQNKNKNKNQRSQNNQSLKQSVNQNKNKNQRSQNNSRNMSVNVTKEPIKLNRKKLFELRTKNNFVHRKQDNHAYNPNKA
jgi:hypothetical protein